MSSNLDGDDLSEVDLAEATTPLDSMLAAQAQTPDAIPMDASDTLIPPAPITYDDTSSNLAIQQQSIDNSGLQLDFSQAPISPIDGDVFPPIEDDAFPPVQMLESNADWGPAQAAFADRMSGDDSNFIAPPAPVDTYSADSMPVEPPAQAADLTPVPQPDLGSMAVETPPAIEGLESRIDEEG